MILSVPYNENGNIIQQLQIGHKSIGLIVIGPSQWHPTSSLSDCSNWLSQLAQQQPFICTIVAGDKKTDSCSQPQLVGT